MFVAVLMAFLSIGCWADNEPSMQVGTQAPDFSAPDVNGVKHKFSEFRGQYVVLDFWASWCGDCRRETPGLKTLFEQYNDLKIDGKPIAWLGVSFDKESSALKSYLDKENLPWLQLCNYKEWKKNPIAKAYDLHWIPTFYIIDAEGKVAGSAITADGLRAELERLSGVVYLPGHSATRGSDIMTTLQNRKTDRAYAEEEVNMQDLSDILWAAGGVNRANGNLTAPTAMNRQEVLVYAVTKGAISLYDAKKNTLTTVARGDHRKLVAGNQDVFNDAPLFILFVGDLNKFGNTGEHAQKMVWVDGGIASENVSVFCASVGIKTCVRATMDHQSLKSLLNLDDNQILMLNNAIGY